MNAKNCCWRCLCCLPPCQPRRRTSAEFYKGKTVRLVVGIGVGSGYDINARLLARHMPKHIPGNPEHHRAEPAGRRLADA